MYKEEYPSYMDESLIRGVVARYMRRVNELNARETNRFVIDASFRLQEELERGVPKKRQVKHFEKLLAEFKKIKAIVPVPMPSESLQYVVI